MSETEFSIDVAPVIPEARATVQRIAEVYVHRCAPWFVGLLVHGSALKGDYLPGCSDIDMQLYLHPDAFSAPANPRLDMAEAIARDLADVDPAPFMRIQTIAWAEDWDGGGMVLVPGSFHMVAGRAVAPIATADQLMARARAALDTLDTCPAYISKALLEVGGYGMPRIVRLLSTDVWPAVRHAAAFSTGDPIGAWSLTKFDAADAVCPAVADACRAYWQALHIYFNEDDSMPQASAAFKTGLACLAEVKAWWEAQARPS